MSAEFRGKKAKSPLQTSAMAHWRGRNDAARVKFTSFCRTRYVHPEKNIFLNFWWCTRLCPFYRTINLVWCIMNSCKRYTCSQKSNTTVATFYSHTRSIVLISRTQRVIIYDVILSAFADTQERRGVLWVLTISGFGNSLLIKT